MGKTTLCNAIVGLMPVRSGAIRFEGRDLVGLEPHQIARAGVGYVPQGRRLWPSLSVDETSAAQRPAPRGAWTVERVYSTFPRLAERRTNGGGQLSGGEQQMLAIARALLGNPRLLVMDEPTEGLAPMIVAQVRDLLIRLAHEEDIAVLVVEQNIGVATAVSDHVAIMVNGRVNRIMDASALAADRDLQQRLLGVGRHGHDETDVAPPRCPRCSDALARRGSGVPRRAAAMRRPTATRRSIAPDHLPNRWGLRPAALAAARVRSRPQRAAPAACPCRFAERIGRTALVVGTFDTKGDGTALHPRSPSRLRRAGAHGRPVDLGKAVARRCHARAGGGDASRRLGGSLLRRSRRVGHGDGGSLCALDRPRTRASAASFRPAARAARRWRPPACAPAAWRTEGHGFDRRVRPGRALCRRRRHHDAPFGGRRSGRQRDHRAGARQRRARARRHDRAQARRRKRAKRGAVSRGPRSA